MSASLCQGLRLTAVRPKQEATVIHSIILECALLLSLVCRHLCLTVCLAVCVSVSFLCVFFFSTPLSLSLWAWAPYWLYHGLIRSWTCLLRSSLESDGLRSRMRVRWPGSVRRGSLGLVALFLATRFATTPLWCHPPAFRFCASAGAAPRAPLTGCDIGGPRS